MFFNYTQKSNESTKKKKTKKNKPQQQQNTQQGNQLFSNVQKRKGKYIRNIHKDTKSNDLETCF